MAVLVTTGRLKGAAAVDAQEYKQSAEARGQARVEFWDNLTLTDWLCEDPESGLSGRSSGSFLEVVSGVTAGDLREQDLEKYTRRWLSADGGQPSDLALACIEAAVIANRLLVEQEAEVMRRAVAYLSRDINPKK